MGVEQLEVVFIVEVDVIVDLCVDVDSFLDVSVDVVVAVQKPSVPQVATGLQHSFLQQVLASGHAPPAQQISELGS